MFGYLTTSEYQLYRVWVFETLFYLVLRFITISTTRNYNHNHLLRCVTFTQLTILHVNIPFLTSSHTLRNLTANCTPPHSLRNWTVSKVKVTLRLTVSPWVLVSSPIWGLWPDIYNCLTVTVFFCGAPSLTRGRVCLSSEALPALVSHLL
jgi:hypothetical protein